MVGPSCETMVDLQLWQKKVWPRNCDKKYIVPGYMSGMDLQLRRDRVPQLHVRYGLAIYRKGGVPQLRVNDGLETGPIKGSRPGCMTVVDLQLGQRDKAPVACQRWTSN